MTAVQKTLPKGWTMVRLGEIGKIITGNTPSKKNDYFYKERYVDFFKPDDFEQNSITFLNESKDFISEEGSKYARIAPTGTVLTTCIGIIGKVGILEQESCFNQQINAIVPDTSKIFSKYLAYAIYKRKSLLERFTNAPVVPIINKSQFSLFEIPLPPLSTQQKIIEILEEADNLRKFRQQADEKMKDLIPSLFIKMFGDPVTNPKGWEVKKLGEVCKFIYGDSLPDKKRNRGNIDVYGSNGVVGKHNTAITESEAIIIGRKGSVGEVNFSAKPCFPIDTTYFIDKRYTKQNLVWLFWLLKFLKLEKLSLIVGVPGLNRNDAYNSLMILPPLPLQQEFAKLIEEVESEKARQTESRKKLDELFNSLMQRAFTGELVA